MGAGGGGMEFEETLSSPGGLYFSWRHMKSPVFQRTRKLAKCKPGKLISRQTCKQREQMEALVFSVGPSS